MHKSLTYLVELFNPETGEIEETDVFAHLDTALDACYWHLRRKSAKTTQPYVSLDGDGELEGVAFISDDDRMWACLSVFHLYRDEERSRLECLRSLADLKGAALIQGIHQNFKEFK